MGGQIKSERTIDVEQRETPEEYLADIRAQIESMSDREQMVNRAILVLGELLCILLTNHDLEAVRVMKESFTELFQQAEGILAQGDKRNLQ